MSRCYHRRAEHRRVGFVSFVLCPRNPPNTEAPALLCQLSQVLGSIGVGEEDVHPTYASLDNVMRNTRNDNTSEAGHVPMLS